MEKILVLEKRIEGAWAKIESGDLSVGEGLALIRTAQEDLSGAKDEASRLREEGLSWLEILFGIGMTAVGFGARGLPSKGPLRFVRSILGGTVRKK